jgi:hypothetical protein
VRIIATAATQQLCCSVKVVFVLWDADVRDPTCQIAETGELSLGAYLLVQNQR